MRRPSAAMVSGPSDRTPRARPRAASGAGSSCRRSIASLSTPNFVARVVQVRAPRPSCAAAVSIVNAGAPRALAAVAISPAFGVTPSMLSAASAVSIFKYGSTTAGSVATAPIAALGTPAIAECARHEAEHITARRRLRADPLRLWLRATHRRLATCDPGAHRPHDGQGSSLDVTRQRNLRGHLLGRRHERACSRRVGLADHQRHAGVAAFANRLVDRDRGRGTARRAPSAICSPPPWPKMSASCAQFGQAKWLMFSMMPIGGMLSFLYIATARRLSASDTCCGVVTTIEPATGTRLAEAQRDVAGAGRHVDDQIVEIASSDFAEELLQRAVQHRPAPDDRRIVAGQESHRDDLQPVLLGRHDLLAVGGQLRLHAEHDRHVRAVDVGVDQADACRRTSPARSRD